MRMFKCSFAAVVAGVVLAFLVMNVALFAQRGYEGPLFWMAAPGDYSGSLWISPPVRSWEDDWSVATSFPERVWEFQVGGAPPNDPCERLPYVTDPLVGPVGLQINQYTGEWWEGTTYVGTPGSPHTSPPPGFDPDLFGFFSFGDRSDRPGVAPGGLPGRLVDNPGACIGHALAVLRGRGDAWRPNDQRDGLDCLSTSSFMRLRMNVELRCEADLRDLDDYTESFWDGFDLVLPAILPDGFTEAPVIFPADYPNGPVASARNFPGRVWVRRIDFSSHDVVWSEGDEPVTSVFNMSLPGVFAPMSSVDPDMAEMYKWQLEGTAAERRASSRNTFMEIDSTGTIVNNDRMIINDLIKEVDDCVSLDLFSGDTPDDGSPMPCGRMNAAGTALFSKDPDGMADDIGPDTPRELLAEVSAPMIAGARGNRQPFPVGGNLFWSEEAKFSTRCTAGYVVMDDLRVPAVDAREFYLELFAEAWVAYQDALAGFIPPPPYQDMEADEILADAVYLRGTALGWNTIFRYRDLTQPMMEEAFFGAGYVPAAQAGADRLLFDFQGAPPPECEVSDLTVQPMRGYKNSAGYTTTPAGGAPMGQLIGVWYSGFDMYGSEQIRPHYSSQVMNHWHGPIGHHVRDSVPGGTVFPEASTHWRGSDDDIMEDIVMNVAVACGSPTKGLYAPDVEQLAILGHWEGLADAKFWTGEQDVRYPGGVRTVDTPTPGFDPARIASYSECEDPRFGAQSSDCYDSPVLAEEVAAYGDTLTSRALQAHVAAGSGNVGAYVFQELLNPSVDRRGPSNRASYGRTSSGDVGPDGARIVYDDATSWETVSYTNTLVDTRIHVEGGLARGPFSDGTVYGGFADWDHRAGGASSANSLEVVEHYWGISPGTFEGRPPGTVGVADEETMTRTGPVRFSGTMDLARNGGVVGSCTLCSEMGCDASIIEEFPNERFTSSVTQGTMVCLIERGLTPPMDCPGP